MCRDDTEISGNNMIRGRTYDLCVGMTRESVVTI